MRIGDELARRGDKLTLEINDLSANTVVLNLVGSDTVAADHGSHVAGTRSVVSRQATVTDGGGKAAAATAGAAGAAGEGAAEAGGGLPRPTYLVPTGAWLGLHASGATYVKHRCAWTTSLQYPILRVW